jgi:chromosome segregation ATPase
MLTRVLHGVSLQAQSTTQSTLQHLETQAHALTETVRQLTEANRTADEQLAAARRERVELLGVQGELKAAALTAEGKAAAAEAFAHEAQATAARAVERAAELQTALSHTQQSAASLEARKQTAEVTAEAEGKRAHAAAAAQEAQEALATQEATVRRATEEAAAAKEAVLSWRARAAKDRTKLQALTAKLHEKDAQVQALS